MLETGPRPSGVDRRHPVVPRGVRGQTGVAVLGAVVAGGYGSVASSIQGRLPSLEYSILYWETSPAPVVPGAAQDRLISLEPFAVAVTVVGASGARPRSEASR